MSYIDKERNMPNRNIYNGEGRPRQRFGCDMTPIARNSQYAISTAI